MEYSVSLHKINIEAATMRLALSCEVPYYDDFTRVQLILHFDNGSEDRRIPFVFAEHCTRTPAGRLIFSGEYTYLLDYIYWKTAASSAETVLYFNIHYGNYYEEHIPVNTDSVCLTQDEHYYHCRTDGNALRIAPGNTTGRTLSDRMRQQRILGIRFWSRLRLQNIRKLFYRRYIKKSFHNYKCSDSVVKNRITFISERRDKISDNFQFVYNAVRDDPDLDIQLYANPKELCDMSRQEMDRFAYLCATSKVIVLNEFTPNIYLFDLCPDTKVIQLWHACGALKVLGFTRLGKPMGTLQNSRHHRNYDYVTVSSSEVCKWYAEDFGIPTSHVVPTGIPRTDVFFDNEYGKQMRKTLLKQYPQLKDKKIILFAPTFRGDIKETAFYPMERFQVDSFLDALGEEYFLIIKHHPFVKEQHPVPEAYRDRVLDLTGENELNDLLFITDLIITDYSSLVFEASLLQIPTLFYVFDLEEYIRNRDLHYSFTSFAPGPLVFTQDELQQVLINKAYDKTQMEQFAKKFFDDFDGHSTQRVADLLYRALNE